MIELHCICNIVYKSISGIISRELLPRVIWIS